MGSAPRLGRRLAALPFIILSAALAAGMPSPLPILGYNTWNAFDTRIDEALVKDTADLLIASGLAAAGYTHLNLDDGWSEKRRGRDGRLVGHRTHFPSGMAALGDYIHSKGLKFGIYGDAGSHTCAYFPGSRGHEEVDAQTWADWGVDYLKYDNCYFSSSDWDPVARYTAMRDAINATGRPITFSLCEWGWLQPWLWADKIGHSWRTTPDIKPNWKSIMHILDASTDLARFAGPDKGWNDADMLEVGNGRLSLGEQRAHFALWALLKSPLLIGADLRSLHSASLAILKAPEVIAINQDALGVPGDLVWVQGDLRIYAAPLTGGSRAVVMLNSGSRAANNVTVHWQQLGLPAGAAATVRDLYGQRDIGERLGAFSTAVPSHDVAVLRITLTANGSSGEIDGATVGNDDWRPWHQLHSPLPPPWPYLGITLAAVAGGTAVAVVTAAAAWIAAFRRRRRGHGWRVLGGTDATVVQLAEPWDKHDNDV